MQGLVQALALGLVLVLVLATSRVARTETARWCHSLRQGACRNCTACWARLALGPWRLPSRCCRSCGTARGARCCHRCAETSPPTATSCVESPWRWRLSMCVLGCACRGAVAHAHAHAHAGAGNGSYASVVTTSRSLSLVIAAWVAWSGCFGTRPSALQQWRSCRQSFPCWRPMMTVWTTTVCRWMQRQSWRGAVRVLAAAPRCGGHALVC